MHKHRVFFIFVYERTMTTAQVSAVIAKFWSD